MSSRRGPILTLTEGSRDEEYSRLSDPARWRIVGARADAWMFALNAAGLAELERNAPVRWEASPRTLVSALTASCPTSPVASLWSLLAAISGRWTTPVSPSAWATPRS